VSGDTVIGDGVLLVDMGAKYKGYCSDFTRTIWVGEKNDQFPIFQKVHKVVARAHNQAVEKYTIGMN
jgi:Xaa-Pro aminopeptidase